MPEQTNDAYPAAGNPTVDLTPCHFQNTFSNPCFWLLLGMVAGAAGVWFLTRERRP